MPKALLAKWELEEDDNESVLPSESVKTMVENEDFVGCKAVHNCANRLRRSEREFAAERIHLAADLVSIPVVNPDDRLRDKKQASGKRTSAFTFAAVSIESGRVAGVRTR